MRGCSQSTPDDIAVIRNALQNDHQTAPLRSFGPSSTPPSGMILVSCPPPPPWLSSILKAKAGPRSATKSAVPGPGQPDPPGRLDRGSTTRPEQPGTAPGIDLRDHQRPIPSDPSPPRSSPITPVTTAASLPGCSWMPNTRRSSHSIPKSKPLAADALPVLESELDQKLSPEGQRRR